MHEDQRNQLRELAKRALERVTPPWELQTSNSFRRIGSKFGGDGDVISPIIQRSDGHPDLLAKPGVLEYIAAADPRSVLELIDELDDLRPVVETLARHADRYQTSRDLKDAIRTYRDARRAREDYTHF